MRLDIVGIHTEVDQNLTSYVNKKIGSLDKYLSRQSRGSAHAEVKLKESKAHGKVEYGCEVILHLPKEVITVHESTMNMYAAVDIVQAKLKHQINKYKDLHGGGKLYHRLAARFKNADSADVS